MKLLFVSSNEGKIKEAGMILGQDLESAHLDIQEIQSLDLKEIVIHKAKYAFKILKRPLIVDDVGLFFMAWNGFPGPFIKYIESVVGYEKLLRMLELEDDRRVSVRSMVGFHDGKKVHTFLGDVPGIFQKKAKGTHGWGFDPYFMPDGHDKTFAQMTPAKKNKISHRAHSFAKLKAHLATS